MNEVLKSTQCTDLANQEKLSEIFSALRLPLKKTYLFNLSNYYHWQSVRFELPVTFKLEQLLSFIEKNVLKGAQ